MLRAPPFGLGGGLFLVSHTGRRRFEELLLAVDKGVGIVSGNFEPVTVGDGVARAGLYAVATKDTTIVINIVDLGITLRGADSMLAGILGRFNVNAIGRARCRAKEASDAFLQPIFIAFQNVETAVAAFQMGGFLGVILRNRGPKHGLKGDGKSLGQRAGGIHEFT